uniref:F-box domain-containing protein n=1 Tax=Globodera pallida TaxID=36090 RepID=A0A183C5U0_GLOPA
MSDNESETEQQQQMEKIFICDDIWYGVFAFLRPFEVGMKMALISDRLDVLVDVHFKSRKWSLGWLSIRRADDGNGAQIVNARSGERLPIPQGPLPTKVIGFKELEISYIDQSVIEFLQRICRRFGSSGTNVWISTADDQSRSWDIIRQKIWPLVNDNICGLLRLDCSDLGRLRQFSPAILRNCPNLRSIHSYGLFPKFPADDNTGAFSRQTVAKWLITPRGDRLPKMLCYDYRFAKIEGLKRAFVNASESANFIIKFLEHDHHFVPFELKNNRTGERLTFRRIDKDKWLLVRCPIGREEDKWTKWEKEAIEWQWNSRWNCIGITFKDRDIGDGMVEANEGPSEEPTDKTDNVQHDHHFVPFELKNNLTGERLTFRRIDEDKWLLVRCPIGREEDKWTKWETEAIQWKWNSRWNCIGITFKDRDIGDGLVEANEGPSEPKKPKK